MMINPRPCGRGDSNASQRLLVILSFNPRPCGRGDLWEWIKVRPAVYVSIRAPAGGAMMLCHIRAWK